MSLFASLRASGTVSAGAYLAFLRNLIERRLDDDGEEYDDDDEVDEPVDGAGGGATGDDEDSDHSLQEP